MNKRNGALYFVLLLCVVLAFGCREKAEPNAACDKVRLAEYECKGDCGNPLCGRWQWVSSAIGSSDFTPASTGRCQAVYLSHDSTWRWILDGKLMDTGWYKTARKVATYERGRETVEEPYDEILFFSRKAKPADLSQYTNDGISYVGGDGFAYHLVSCKLYLGDPPGLIGGASYTWEKCQ